KVEIQKAGFPLSHARFLFPKSKNERRINPACYPHPSGSSQDWKTLPVTDNRASKIEIGIYPSMLHGCRTSEASKLTLSPIDEVSWLQTPKKRRSGKRRCTALTTYRYLSQLE
ncbi:MAG TPA: hypothetical protein VHY84_26200, partial [Bryobacteraceae bacterium]|nr:hypothetical protein [Bryobacteraceae bacterium]